MEKVWRANLAERPVDLETFMRLMRDVVMPQFSERAEVTIVRTTGMKPVLRVREVTDE